MEEVARAFKALPRPQLSPYSGQPNHWVFGIYRRPLRRQDQEYLLITNPESDFLSLTGPVVISSNNPIQQAKVIVATLLQAFVNGIRDGDVRIAGVMPFAPWTWAYVPLDRNTTVINRIDDEIYNLQLPERLYDTRPIRREVQKFGDRYAQLQIELVRQRLYYRDATNGLRKHELVPVGAEFRCHACNSLQNPLIHPSQPRGCSNCFEPYYHAREHLPEYQAGHRPQRGEGRRVHWADCQAYCSAADRNFDRNRRNQNAGANRRNQNAGPNQRNQNLRPDRGRNRYVRGGPIEFYRG